MPKDDIDYSNTIIYKIYCKDETITDIYVGHTTNFIQRKYQHKISSSSLDNKLKIYNTIRANGGWTNWDMIEIAKYNCKDHTEARIKEQEHYEQLKATLNSCPPFVNKNNYFCKICNTQCVCNSEYLKHIGTTLHNKKLQYINTDAFTPKNSEKFICDKCDFKCCKKGDWNRHLTTSKHIHLTFSNIVSDTKNIFNCNFCNKIYNSRNGLWNHKKKCKANENNTQLSESSELTDKDLIMMLINDNKELRNVLIEQNKEKDEFKTIILKVLENGTNNVTTTNNSNNKSFNLNFFLNETCKDAMNITDFVDSIKLQLSDLEGVGELGYVEGISNIIVKNLKQLDVTQRPLHCTDKKRETIYIKDDDKWEKDEEKDKMHKIVRKVADKNARMLPKFKEAHPDCNKAASKYSDAYNKIIVESMGGSGDNNFEKEEKIIKKVAKEVTVEKDTSAIQT